MALASAAAATLANISFKMRMNLPPGDSSRLSADFDATLQSRSDLGKGPMTVELSPRVPAVAAIGAS
jgi:hypothetical protein